MFNKVIFFILCVLIIGESIYLAHLYQKWERLRSPSPQVSNTPVATSPSYRISPPKKSTSAPKPQKVLSAEQKQILKYHRMLRKNPQDPDILFELGKLRLQLGQAQLAYKYFQKTLRLSPHHKYKKYIQDNLEELKKKLVTKDQGIIKK